MSLFTDNDVVTRASLVTIDPELPDVSTAEDISIEGGAISTAWNEAASALSAAVQRFGEPAVPVYPYASFGVNQPRVRLSQLVTTSFNRGRVTPLVSWMQAVAIEAFYAAAVNRRVSDRYSGKLSHFSVLRKRRWLDLWAAGLPVVERPLPCPGAIHEPLLGTFSASNVSDVSGGATAETAYDVAITWVDGSKYASATSKGNAESGPGAVVNFTVPLNRLLSVSIAGLTAPDGTLKGGTAEGTYSPLKATAWNVYVGTPGGVLYLQNSSPVAVATTSYTLTGAPTLSGAALEPGQYPDSNIALQVHLNRA